MKILQPILLIFLYLIIGAYGLVALHLIAHGILDLRKKSVTDEVRFGHLTNRELFQTGSRLSANADGATHGCPGNIGINAPPARTPPGKLLVRLMTHRQ